MLREHDLTREEITPMAINPKEKAALESAWGKSKPAAAGRLSTCEWPDGEYQFEVTTWEPDAAKAKIKAGYTIIGGNEALTGEEHLQFENLTGSEQSMDYFKARLLAFGLTLEEVDSLGVDEVLGDRLKEMVLGKKFVGQAKTKNDYLNVYANRPIEDDGSGSSSEAAAEGQQAEEGEAEGGIAKGSRVTFTSKVDGEQAGEVLEIDAEVARVKADNGKVYKLPVDRLAAEAAAETETEEVAAEETEEVAEEPAAAANGKRAKLPAPKAIQAMRAPELRDLFKKVGLKFEAVKQPREFLAGVAGFIHDKKFMPSIAMLPALSAQLGIKAAKGAKPAEVVKQLREKALARFS